MSVYEADFNSTSSFPHWTFTLCLVFVLWTLVQGAPQVIGSDQPIKAAPGNDVILPCHVEPVLDVQGMTVEWNKPDLMPDPDDRLSQVAYVHLYRHQADVPNMKLPSYVNRTQLFVDDLKSGNISLKIKNVTLADDGRYRCIIPNLGSSVIRLVVDPDFGKTCMTETSLFPITPQTTDPRDKTPANGGRSRVAFWIPFAVLIVILILGSVATIFFKHLCQKQNLSGHDVTQKHVLPVSMKECCRLNPPGSFSVWGIRASSTCSHIETHSRSDICTSCR